MSIELKVEKVRNGDCIWLRYGENEKSNILIDSGPGICAKAFREIIEEIEKREERISLLILTHIDNDHIMGFKNSIDRINCSIIDKIWINGDGIHVYERNAMNSPQNVGSLMEKIREKGINLITPIFEGHEDRINGAYLKVITPKKEAVLEVGKLIDSFNLNTSKSYAKDIKELYDEDQYDEENTPTNKASISFIFSYNNKKIAFLGDAVASDVIEGIGKHLSEPTVDWIKIAHHGSKHNTSTELLKLFGAKNFIISKMSTVDKETISRIANIEGKVEVYCNYNWWDSIRYFSNNDYMQYLKTGKLKIEERSLFLIN